MTPPLISVLLSGCAWFGNPTPQDTDPISHTGDTSAPPPLSISQYGQVVWQSPGEAGRLKIFERSPRCEPCLITGWGGYRDDEWGLPGPGFAIILSPYDSDPTHYLYQSTPDDVGYPTRTLGCGMGFDLGDIDGDGGDDLICAGGGGTWLLPGPWPAPGWYAWTDEEPLPAYLGLNFSACDLNADGQADLCSVLGTKIGPVNPGDSQGAGFDGVGIGDQILWLDDGEDRILILYQSPPSKLYVLDPGDLTNLPNTVVSPRDIARYQTSAQDEVFSIDLYQNPGERTLILGTTRSEDRFKLLGWYADTLDPAFSLDPGIPLFAQSELVVSDFNNDGVNDIAFSAGKRLGVILGPLDGSSEVAQRWNLDDVDSVGPYSKSGLAALGRDLWVGSDSRTPPPPPEEPDPPNPWRP